MDMLVTPDWLAAQAGAADLRILDATYHALDPARDARVEFEAGHVPGALFLDLENLRDRDDPLPSTVPHADQMAARLAALGVRAGDRIVLYDQAAHHTSARAWWLLRSFGVEQVALLDGGFARWRREGRPVAHGPVAEPVGGNAGAAFRPEWFRDTAAVAAVVAGGTGMSGMGGGRAQIVDARSPARFTGAEGDPRAGVAPGHMPGAINLPYGRMFDAGGDWQTPTAIADAFGQAGVDLDRPIVTTCGSGITASVLLFALALTGRADGALYDGSWSEWGALPHTPKAVTA